MEVVNSTPTMSHMKRNWDHIRYKEALESCRFFNARLLRDRAQRQPYTDSHTGVAQMKQTTFSEQHRRPAQKPDQVYSYPTRRFICKSRPKHETMCPNDPPERPATPEHTALDEMLARHLAQRESDDSDDEEYGKRRKRGPQRRKRKTNGGIGF